MHVLKWSYQVVPSFRLVLVQKKSMNIPIAEKETTIPSRERRQRLVNASALDFAREQRAALQAGVISSNNHAAPAPLRTAGMVFARILKSSPSDHWSIAASDRSSGNFPFEAIQLMSGRSSSNASSHRGGAFTLHVLVANAFRAV